MFINSFNIFRAIAIIIIVTSHCYYNLNIEFNTVIEKTIKNLITGGTVNFVFISGFLFHHIFYHRYSYYKFIKSKTINILLPYTLLSLPIFILLFIKSPGLLEQENLDFLSKNIYTTIKFYISGAHMIAYWYIPFIMLVFISSPLHIFFIKLSTNKQLSISLVLLICSAFIHRPLSTNIYSIAIQSFIYFTPIYLLGIMASIYKDKIYIRLKNRNTFLLITGLFLAILQSHLGKQGPYSKDFFTFGGIDIMLFQKIILCFFFMSWLHKFEHIKNKYIDYIATTSFATFFLHGYILRIIHSIINKYHINISHEWIVFFLMSVLVTTTSILLALLCKSIIPKYSRKIIGY